MAGSKFQEKMNRQGQQYIAGLQNTVRVLWEKCCEEDGIPVDSRFVVFDDNNKYNKFYNKAVKEWMEAIAQYRAGGYVGLTMRR